MAVIETFGGCCHGPEYRLRVVREKVKSGINTVTEVLPTQKRRRIKLGGVL